MCWWRPYGSTDMQHGIFWSGHDLELRSNFQHDLSRLNYSSFDASWQEKHDVGKMIVMSLQRQKLLPDFFNVFSVFALLRPNSWSWIKPEVMLVKARQNSYRMRFSVTLLLVPELWAYLQKKKLKTVKFDLWWPVWWPDLWPDLKNDRNDFVIIFDAHLNVAYRVSLHDLRAELEGEGLETSPARRGLTLFR